MRKSRFLPSLALFTCAYVLFAQDLPRIVCFGDSLTAGYGLDPGQSYPDLLQRELDRRGYHYQVVNRGESGDTTQDGLGRLSSVLNQHPQIVILEFGANDGLRGQPVSVAEMHLARLIEELRKAGAKVMLAGITLPPNYGADYVKRFDAMYTDLAKRYQLPLLPFLLDGVATKPELMQQDGLHPNAAGTRIVVQNVLKTLQPLLTAPSRSRLGHK
ncbi:MAG TPA: arylesterase [Bryobacteraceae bacterium]|nr:arylesterase [Bryobacteraceae bacterium]